MLATLALASVLTLPHTNATQVVRRGEMSYDSQSMHVHNEQVPDPNDPTKTVNARVSYHIRFRIHVEDEPDDYEVARVVRTRPEQPAKNFQMSQMRMGIEEGRANTASIQRLANTLNGAG